MTVTMSEPFSPEELAEARRYSMLIFWSTEDEVYLVSFPEFPGPMTHGSTVEEASAMGEEVIALMLSSARDLGEAFPDPPRAPRHLVLAVPSPASAADIAALRRRLNISQCVLAAAMNVSPSAVESWEQGRKQPDGASLRLLDLFRRHPELVEELLEPKPAADPTPSAPAPA